MKIYLDINIIFGYFWAKVKELKGKVNKFIEPKIIEFLRKNKDNFQYFTTTLVKAELTRRLKTELGIERNKINELWTDIKEIKLRDISAENIWEKVLQITEKIEIKKRVANLEH